MNLPALRSKDEIQRAHDLIQPIVSGHVPIEVKPEGLAPMRAALDVLCWVLHHDDNEAFASNLAVIEGMLREHGIVLTRVQ